MVWLYLCLRYFLEALSEEIFVVHDVHCLTRVTLRLYPEHVVG